jgi:hypothetical protein
VTGGVGAKLEIAGILAKFIVLEFYPQNLWVKLLAPATAYQYG